MPEDKDNIVKRVFDRPRTVSDKTSSLLSFTNPTAAPASGKPAKPGKSPRGLGVNRLPTAIDMGTSSVRLMQLARDQKGGLEVIHFDEETCTGAGTPSERQKAALLKLLGRHRVKGEVVTGFSSKEMQAFHLVFPPMSNEELDEAVRWKVSQLKPFGLEPSAVEFRYMRFDETATGEKPGSRRVLLVCVGKETAARRMQLLTEAGLNAFSIEVLPVGIVNLSHFVWHAAAKEEAVLWIDLGADESVLTVEKAGRTYFFRNLTTTSRQLTAQVAQHCRVNETEAESLKRLHGLSFWSPDQKAPAFVEQGQAAATKESLEASVYYALISTLENLVVDIEHSFKYFSYQISQSQITRFDRVMLSGGGADLRKLDAFLSWRLGVPVLKVHALAGLRISDAVASKHKTLADSVGEYASVVALAVSPAISSADRIDLSASKRKGSAFLVETVKKHRVAAAVTAVAIAGGLFGPPAAKMTYYQAREKVVSAEMSRLQAELKRRQTKQLKLGGAETDLLKKKGVLESRLKALDESAVESKKFSDVLTQLASMVPDTMRVRQLSYEESKLSLIGSAQETELVVDFLNRLRASKTFSEVAFHYTQREAEGRSYAFEIVADLPL